MITTITVNQWRVKSNAETGADEPVICVNHYEYRDDHTWGPKVGETEHHHELDIPTASWVVYDPLNKTPCGASCWMEVNHA